MDLLEYQAKELFHQRGIPVLPSQRIEHPKDLKGLKIPYPVVLKSQVRTGGRGKAGGVKFVENTIDAIAAAQTIFHLPIKGEYPKVLLAESKYDAAREFYLAVVLDSTVRRPVLLGSQQGGIGIESTMDHVQHVVVDDGFSSFYARRLAIQMGLQGPLIGAVSTIIEKMYHLFIDKDLDLVEINPLGVSASDDVMALDGKVTVNDYALDRHPDIAALVANIPGQNQKDRGLLEPLQHLDFVGLEGNIGILCNGTGLTLATMDLVSQAGGKPANLLNVGRETNFEPPAQSLCGRIAQGLDQVARHKGVKVVLVNILGNVTDCEAVSSLIVDWWQRSHQVPRSRPVPQVIVRLVGDRLEAARETLTAIEIPMVENLEEAVGQAVKLAKA